MSSYELIKPEDGEIWYNPLYMGYEVRIKDKWYLIETFGKKAKDRRVHHGEDSRNPTK